MQAHLTAIKGFTRWLTENHKLRRDPLASVRKPNPKADRRYERRMLLPEEWRWLEATTASGPARYDMSSNDRLLLYGTAIQTGLRSAELRSLTRGRLYLDANPPFITCKTGPTKNRKGARQYIHAELADDLMEHLATKAPRAKVFAMPDNSDVAVMFRADLAEARREWMKAARHDPEEFSRRDQSDFLTSVNHDGEIVDFHSLRHTTGAWLAMAGVHPKAVQTIMRHSTITLTMDAYGHLFPGQEADAAARLGDVFREVPEILLATGTDGAGIEARGLAQRLAQRAGRESLPADTKGCDEQRGPQSTTESPKSLRLADLGEALRDDAKECPSAPRRTRTFNPLIKSQMLCQLS